MDGDNFRIRTACPDLPVPLLLPVPVNVDSPGLCREEHRENTGF